MADLFGAETPKVEIPAALFDTLPYVKGSDTSKAAADSMIKLAGHWRRRVYECIALAGAAGMTCDEVEAKLGGKHQNISARVRELAKGGHIYFDQKVRRLTRSRRSARVYWAGKGPK
jgi:hypothetical protein